MIRILTVILQSDQFAELFPDVEALPYTEAHQESLISYGGVEKSETF